MNSPDPQQEYANALHRIAELEAHNEQLLADKEASPAIIAGYRERGEQLLARIAELEQQLAETDQAIVDRLLRMKELDKENASLKDRIAELEQQLEEEGKEYVTTFREGYDEGMERAAEIMLAIGYCEDDAELDHIRREIEK